MSAPSSAPPSPRRLPAGSAASPSARSFGRPPPPHPRLRSPHTCRGHHSQRQPKSRRNRRPPPHPAPRRPPRRSQPRPTPSPLLPSISPTPNATAWNKPSSALPFTSRAWSDASRNLSRASPLLSPRCPLPRPTCPPFRRGASPLPHRLRSPLPRSRPPFHAGTHPNCPPCPQIRPPHRLATYPKLPTSLPARPAPPTIFRRCRTAKGAVPPGRPLPPCHTCPRPYRLNPPVPVSPPRARRPSPPPCPPPHAKCPAAFPVPPLPPPCSSSWPWSLSSLSAARSILRSPGKPTPRRTPCPSRCR